MTVKPIYGDETQRAHEKIRVHDKESAGFRPSEYGSEIFALQVRKRVSTVLQEQEEQGGEHTGILGYHCSCCYTAESHTVVVQPSNVDSKGKDDAHKYVHAVDNKVSRHRADAVLHADEPAFEGHQT